MPLFKTASTPTHEEKLLSLAATKEAALSVFAVAEADLHGVRAEAEQVYSDLDAEIGRLRLLQDEAALTSDEARSKAAKIRSTFLGE